MSQTPNVPADGKTSGERRADQETAMILSWGRGAADTRGAVSGQR